MYIIYIYINIYKYIFKIYMCLIIICINADTMTSRTKVLDDVLDNN